MVSFPPGGRVATDAGCPPPGDSSVCCEHSCYHEQYVFMQNVSANVLPFPAVFVTRLQTTRNHRIPSRPKPVAKRTPTPRHQCNGLLRKKIGGGLIGVFTMFSVTIFPQARFLHHLE